MDKESKFLSQLQNQYGHCQLCGTTKACKITVAGAHHPLSNNQLSAWAKSLVCISFDFVIRIRLTYTQTLGKHGVTLRTPPRDVGGQNLFSMFFKTSHDAIAPSAIPLQPQFGSMHSPYMMPPHFPYMSPWGMPGPTGNPYMAGPQPTNTTVTPTGKSHASTSALPSTLPSSDPPDMDAPNPYPEISDFPESAACFPGSPESFELRLDI